MNPGRRAETPRIRPLRDAARWALCWALYAAAIAAGLLLGRMGGDG